MSQSPLTPAALRGAIDLSGLKRPSGGTASAAAPEAGGIVVTASDATFSEVLATTSSVPALLVVWSGRLPQSRDFLDVVIRVAEGYAGRLRVVSVDIDTSPGLLQALQVQSVPVVVALIKGQPVPLFAGVYPEDQMGPVFDQVLALASREGVSGTIPMAEAAEADEEAEPLPPLHQQAFDAIEAGDLPGAEAAYRSALADNPGDAEAAAGLAQVGLLARTADLDLGAVREAAAADPTDIDAQLAAADVDLLGGHVEDAFTRLVDLVRATGGADRDRVRARLLDLFAVVGNHDERVRKGRTALMSALF